MNGVCPYCGIEVVPSKPDPWAFAVGVDGSTYCPPGTPGQEDKVFPLHGWQDRP